jgi:NAD(P)-dependent dehydrogenase (short-subunit alcohol dehydrogenase family)
MGTYAVTGSASGMGHQVAQKLRDAGHTVIGVDIKQADIVADLSTGEGRQAAAVGVLAASGSRLDGAVLAAGLGPTRAADRARLIAQVNYFGVVELLDAWRPALAAADRAKVVVFSSNSTTTTPMVPARTVRAFLAYDASSAGVAINAEGGEAHSLLPRPDRRVRRRRPAGRLGAVHAFRCGGLLMRQRRFRRWWVGRLLSC